MDEIKVGKRIADLRNANHVTQLELAEKLGVPDRAVSKWETGSGYPDIALLPQIADIFHVSVDYLLRGKPILKQKIYVDYTNSRYNDFVNNHYLSNGWKIVDMKLCGDGEGACCCAVLLEKEIFENQTVAGE